MRSESLKRAQKVYRKKGKQFHFYLNEKDTDIVEWLAETPNATAKIKELIRSDIRNNNVTLQG